MVLCLNFEPKKDEILLMPGFGCRLLDLKHNSPRMAETSNLFSYIQDIIFHATPLDHYFKILETGAIEPNRGQLSYGMLPSATEPHGKCHVIGAVSLFDGFDRNTVENQWPILNAEIYVFFVLDRKVLPGELLDCDAADRRFPRAKDYKCIHPAERLHIGAIPIETVTGSFLVHSAEVFCRYESAVIPNAEIESFRKQVHLLPKSDRKLFLPGLTPEILMSHPIEIESELSDLNSESAGNSNY